MFRRLFWLVVGAGFGFGVSFWLMRVVREATERYRPEHLTAAMAAAARQLGQDLRAALAEGHDAMRAREGELRAEVGNR